MINSREGHNQQITNRLIRTTITLMEQVSSGMCVKSMPVASGRSNPRHQTTLRSTRPEKNIVKYVKSTFVRPTSL